MYVDIHPAGIGYVYSLLYNKSKPFFFSVGVEYAYLIKPVYAPKIMLNSFYTQNIIMLA